MFEHLLLFIDIQIRNEQKKTKNILITQQQYSCRPRRIRIQRPDQRNQNEQNKRSRMTQKQIKPLMQIRNINVSHGNFQYLGLHE